MFGVSDQAAAFRSCCCDERSSLVATKGPRWGGGGADQVIGGVVRGAGESDNRVGLGAIFPSGIPVATLGKIRVCEVSRG